MKKKIVAILCATVKAFCLTGCNKQVMIDGVVYLTSSYNCTLMNK